ncbi:ABC transporter permease [Thiohalophilus thiocyanatoxydans]|uniref:Transport permease protein n=1 Tax=Thiohalophilus thiocyanatoxydans TaxID=381308 RepID=A0A4R8IW86_9GAMM|nr:ABC transporter permease [Thiohalophilus thiocyanatoxydans]TDY01653.1 ABC-2 type transport system permease protein [Thiohalophilus thiocyanatoxydans]
MKLSQQYVAFSTILTKEFLRFIRIWIQTVLPAAITTGLYFIIFGNLIGSQLSDIGGLTYMEYIVPGIILMAIINNSYANVVSSFYGAKFQRHVEEMLISPMPNYLIVLGYAAGGMARGLIVGLAVTAVSLIFAEPQLHHILVTLYVVLMTSLLFALGGFVNAVYAKSFDDISIIPTFVLTPLTYLGGIFYSIDMLPQFWQNVSLVNPILYMINAMRYGMLGVSDIDIRVALLIITGFVVVLYLFCLYLLNKGVGIRT